MISMELIGMDEQRERPAYVLAGRLKMRRDVDSKCYLVVEGRSDKRVFENLTDPETCEIFVVTSETSARKTVIDVICLLNENPEFGALGIIDSDYEVLNQEYSLVPNLINTDGHDLETLLIESPALEKVLREYAQEDKVANFEQGKDIRAYLWELASPLGYLRFHNYKTPGLNLRFEGLDFSKFVHASTWTLDVERMVNAVRNLTGVHTCPSCEELSTRIEDNREPTHDMNHVCCGHDLVEILTIGLRRKLGTHNSNDLKLEQVDRSLRLAYEFRFFKHSRMYRDILGWQRSNAPFKALVSESSGPSGA